MSTPTDEEVFKASTEGRSLSNKRLSTDGHALDGVFRVSLPTRIALRVWSAIGKLKQNFRR